MEKAFIYTLEKYIDYLESVRSVQADRLDELKDFSGLFLKPSTSPSGKKYYGFYRPGSRTYKYLGDDDCKDVINIKESRYYSESLQRIESNLLLCSHTYSELKRTDYGSINEALPALYRNTGLSTDRRSINKAAEVWKKEMEAYKAGCGPWYPEGLKTTTVDKSKVRSKSEGLIYNHYYNCGITFVYELPIQLGTGQIRHPDFSILIEIDWRTVILHDHQGMYGIDSERRRYENDMYLYWQNGFIPGINIFYTFDTPDGGFDIGAVQNIIDSVIRPKQ